MFYSMQKQYSLPDIIREDNLIQKVTEGFTNITGYCSGEILGKSIDEVFNTLLRSSICAEKILETRDSFHIFTRNLEAREVIAYIFFELGELTVSLEEKANSRIEEKLCYVEQLCRIEKAGIAVYSANHLVLLKANRTFIDCLKEPFNKKENCLGKTACEIFKGFKEHSGEDVCFNFIKNNGSYFGKELACHNQRNGITYWDMSIVPIYENGIAKYFVVNATEVTDRVLFRMYMEEQNKKNELQKEKERERNRILQNTLKMKDEYLVTITHEFKTPLTVINAVLQTIDGIYTNQIPDHVKKHLQRIRINTYRQLRLVNNLLDIARYNSGRFKINRKNMDIVFISRSIVNSVDTYSAQKGVNLFFSSDMECMEMAMDEEKYERILLNLLSNSIKFTPKGKSIYVHISCRKRHVLITISDEGIGIPKSKQKLIFERFGQVDNTLSRQAEGTGIGLSLVKTLVEGMKGTITINSEVGKGSTFTVSLPVTRMRKKEQEDNIIYSTDNRIMQAVAIEFSDIYLS